MFQEPNLSKYNSDWKETKDGFWEQSPAKEFNSKP